MDKTTTWLIRGASLVIIVFGSIAFNDYLQAKRTLNEVEVATKDYLGEEQAIERCKSVQEIPVSKLLDLAEKRHIKRLLIADMPDAPFFPDVLVKTKRRAYRVVDELWNLDDELQGKFDKIFAKQNIETSVVSSNEYLAQCK